MDRGVATGLLDLIVGDRIWIDAEEDVLANSAADEGGFLGDEGEVLAPSVDVDGRDVLAVAEDVTLSGLVEAANMGE